MFCNKFIIGKLVKVLPENNSNSNVFDVDTLRITSISSSRELDQYVVLESHMYQEIFGKKKIASNASKKRLSVVKISYNGSSIYRAYLSAPVVGFKKDYVALTPNSIYELSQEEKINLLDNVTLTKGSWWKYYWNSPNAAERMSFRIGICGILVTILLSYSTIWSLMKYCISLF